MNRLTLSIVGKTLFDADVESQAMEVGEALTGVMDTFWMMMLPFADVIERLPVPKLRRARMSRVRLDADHLPDDRRSPRQRPRPRRPAVDAARGAGRRRRRGDDRRAGARRGDDDLPRRPRDDGERADLALVSGRRRAGRRGEAARGSRSRPAGPPAGARRCRRRCRMSSASSTEAMRLYPPAWIIGRRALVDYPIGGYTVPARSIIIMSPYVIQRDRAVLRRARALRSGPLDAGVPRRAAEVRLFPVRRRPAPVHRRIVRVDGADPGCRDDRAAVEAAPRSRPPGRDAAAGHAANEARHAHDGREACVAGEFGNW